MSFGANLEKMRRKIGWQINTLEKYSGIPKQRLSEYEAGTTSPNLTDVLALAYLFSTTPQELLDMPVDKNAKKTANSQSDNGKKTEEPKATQSATKGKKSQLQNGPQKGSEGESFGTKLKKAKIKNNLSYSIITKKLGISLATYIQFELDHAMPNPELKAKICQLLKIDE